MDDADIEQRVRARAHAIWEQEGRPEGKHLQHGRGPRVGSPPRSCRRRREVWSRIPRPRRTRWKKGTNKASGEIAPMPAPAAIRRLAALRDQLRLQMVGGQPV